MDILKIAFFSTIFGIMVTFAGAIVLLWNNVGSRNLALAFGTVIGAIILFGTQMFFELRTSEEIEFVDLEYCIDRGRPQISRWDYSRSVRLQIHAEIGASEWIAKNKPELFNTDREKLTSDMTLFSIISYIAINEYDWQRRRITLVGSTGSIETGEPLSRPGEYSLIDEYYFRSILESANNAFAQAKIYINGKRKFPPKTDLKLTQSSLIINNPFCEVIFERLPFIEVNSILPGTGGKVPMMPSGESRYETRKFQIKITTKFKALRAQHRDMPKYKKWTADLRDGVKEWFKIGIKP